MTAMTIDYLYEALVAARAKGLGSKKILITNDNECNGFHEMFHAVSDIVPENFYISRGMLPTGISVEDAKKDYVVVG